MYQELITYKSLNFKTLRLLVIFDRPNKAHELMTIIQAKKLDY